MDEIYTITKQYHEQKDIYIWVVRVIPKVDKETFYDLRSLAKDWDGYYSSYRGVNGFVFQTEEDAHSFADSLSDYIDIPCEEISEPKIEQSVTNKKRNKKTNTIQDKTYTKVELTPSKMPLHEALREVVDREGKEILKDLRLINILDDYKAFEENPSSKFILKSIINEGYSKFILSISDWNSSGHPIILKFVLMTGLDERYVKRIFDNLAYALRLIELKDLGKIESNSNETKENKSKLDTTKPWKKLSINEREEYLNSLVEIKPSTCGLTYDSIYIADDTNEFSSGINFNINYEVSGVLKKDSSVNLAYAIYDVTNRLRKKEVMTSTIYASKRMAVNMIESRWVCLNFKYTEIGKILMFMED